MTNVLNQYKKYAYVILLCHLALVVQFTTVAQSRTDTLVIHSMLKRAAQLQTVNVDSCYLLSEQALRLSEESQYLNGLRKANIRLGSVMMIKGKFDSAEFYLQKAKEISVTLNDEVSLAGVLMLLSYVYEDQGKRVFAFATLYESLKLSVKANNVSLTTQTFNALGELYLDNKDYTKAKVMFKKALQNAKNAELRGEEGAALMGIGSVYYQSKEIHEALKYYMEADRVLRQAGDVVSVAQNLNNIALCYGDLKNEKQALHYYGLALDEYQKQGMKKEEANAYYNIGSLYFDIGKYDIAIENLKKSIVISQATVEVLEISKCYELLAKTYAKKGLYKDAYFYHEQFSLLSDSLMNIEKIRSISEMQTKYETEIKTSEIKVLQRENDISRLRASRSLGINFGLGGALIGIVFVALAFYNQSKKKQRLNLELQIEKQKSDDLLLNILPAEIADELKQRGIAKAKQYNHVTVLFTDCVNFTGISEQMSPTELVEEINKNFTAFDAIMDECGLEKIKTIGDAYLAVCGLPHETADHAQRVVKAAVAIQQFMQKSGGRFQIRIGIHSGSVVAGIVGVKKYAYDIWGDTVNTAARMEQNSEAGKINISGATYELVKNDFTCEHRGKIQAKNKGEIDMYFVKADNLNG